MKLASYRGQDGAARVGAVVNARIADLDQEIADLTITDASIATLRQHGVEPALRGMLRLLQSGAAGQRQLAGLLARKQSGDGVSIDQVELLAPIPRPGKIVAVGRNYADHAKETGVKPFEKPRIIAKLPSSVTGPHARIARPKDVQKLDFEVELAVVIGSFARNVSRERALDHVAGYCVLNDLSAREFQFDVSPAQTTFAKSMDGFCPMGPWIVTKDEIDDPQALEVGCEVNGQQTQHGHTADMLFPVDFLIEYLSRFMTLEPGDVIATGTPAGIGAFRDPPVWLKPGDRIRMEIPRIGVIEHEIVEPA